MLKLNRHFEKSYRSVQLIAALAMHTFYSYDPKNEDDPLIKKTDDFEKFIIKNVRGFYFQKLDGIDFFIRKIFTFFKVKNNRILEKLIFSRNHKRDYQIVMNYIYDNFQQEELEEIFRRYQNTDARIDTCHNVDYIFAKI